MKSLLLALALACLCPVQTCEAIPSSILGRWNFEITSFYQGQKIPMAGTSMIRRFGTTGIFWQSKLNVAGQPAVASRTWFYDSGELYGEASEGGIITATVTGTWWESGNQVFYTTETTSLYADYTQDTSLIIRGRKKIDVTGIASIGMRLAGAMTRK